MFSRAIVIVLDSVGVGELPDAALYGDEGSNTLGNIAARRAAEHPDARRAGPVARSCRCRACRRRRRRLAALRPHGRASAGKDSVTGHWELMGVVLDRAFPTFPDGFPAGADRRVRSAHRPPDRSATSSRPARRSSTSSAPSTCETGSPIVYTSADSVFQIAAHEDDRPGAAALRVVRDRVRACRRGPRPGPRDRAAVRRRSPGRSSAPPTGTTTRCRRRARRCSIG